MRSWTRLLAPLSLAASLLTGCGTAAVYSCPPIVAYSPEFNARLADELEAMPAGTAVERAILDYAALRDQLRACRRLS